ncbi:MAG: DUF1761 domain-containing protein [Pseudomonadota bacterium]
MELINWWAVLAATALAFLLGGIWYGPIFGQAWLDALGKTEADIQPSASPFVISFFTAGVTAVVLAWLIVRLGITGWVGGAWLGCITGIGFIATAMASDSAFCRWSLKLFLIQSGYRVLYSILMGALLGAWQ